MAYAEAKAKLGDRGKVTGEKTFNKETGSSSNNQSSPQTSWQGTTKGDTTHKKVR